MGKTARLLGPIGAETAYRKAAQGEYDGVVAMYHDQATIPMKLLAFGDAVNVTAGLSIVRTSVDHGTAYDIAWRTRADEERDAADAKRAYGTHHLFLQLCWSPRMAWTKSRMWVFKNL